MRPRSSGSSSSRPVSAGSVGSTGSGSEVPFPLLQPVPGPVLVITVVKDSSGYGMKVSGDNPVFVQSVKADGASERAGLRQGDRILKVNGVDVTHSTHVEVVELIRADAQVVLTVQQQSLADPAVAPTSASRSSTMPASPPGPPGGGGRHHGHHHHVSAPAGLTKSARDSITGPQPVDLEKKRQMESQRKHTYRLMLEEEQRHIESLRYDLAKNNDIRTSHELAKAERRVRTLQEQLIGLEAATTSPDFYPSHSSPSAYFPVGVSPPPPPLPPSRPRTLSPLSSSPPALPPRNPPATPSPAAAVNVDGVAAGATAQLLSINEHSLSPTTNRASYHNQPSTGHNLTHQRTKSSPDPLGNSTSVTDGRLSTLSGSESVQNLSYGAGRREKGMSGLSSSSWDVDSPRITPPGTPPPPYRGSSIAGSQDIATPNKDEDKNGADEIGGGASSPDTGHGSAGFSPTIQQPIISMEDDEMSDQETMEDHGPFKSLNKLWQHNAHLAVFFNYVLSNCDPSSLLFYLITDLYKEGNAKEMKKWAYEIHSSFLVPGAPLRLSNVDENVAREVDEVLLRESDKEEILRKVFWKPRAKAKEELTEQLADFRQKRVAGLGTLFGPPDFQLEESIHDKSKETKIIENSLLPKVEPCVEQFEREMEVKREADVRQGVLCAAVCTVASKLFNVRPSHLLERVPTFVSKDKSLKIRLLGRSRKVTAQGHQLVAHQYYAVTYCNNCGLIIGGIGPQGYQCTSCLLNIHRWCVRTLEESCAGPLLKKDKGNDRISKLMERIRPEREARRKPSHLNASHLEKMQKKNSEERDELGGLFDFEGNACGERSAPTCTSRRADGALSEERSDTSMDHNHLDAGSAPLQPPLPVISGSRKPTTSINRSESYKERAQKRQLRERRKTSDPNLSKSTDVDADGSGLQYNNNSGSSSNSTQSLRSLDSPSNSLEMVTGVPSVTSRLLDPANPLTQASSDDGGLDSDMEAEPDPPDWTRLVSEAELKQLSPREKKRQEVINELFHTERSHVRALRVLDQVFYRPLCESHILPSEQIALLFPNLNSMLDIHSGFNNAMKARRKETPLVGDISDMLLNMFDGPAGEEFQREAATFCAKQQFALEALKEKRRKDQKLNNFLTEAEGNPLCRRLQLKDIIPTGMLRLTKYPLLFDNLVKLCEPGSTERAGVQRALDRSKEILNHVNQAVREAEDLHRLAEIHKRLDKTSFDKTEHAIATEFKHLDLTRHRLVFEGALSWRQSKGQKSMELHVVLLEEMIMLLQKQDDKFVLKFHNAGGQDSKNLYSPLIKFSTVLIRPVATDKKAFFLVNTSASNAQIYELVALSSSERKTWFRHISEAADAYKMREGRARRPDLMPVPILPTPADTSSNAGSEDKESGDSAAAATDQGGASSIPSAPAAPESTDSGFQEGNADTGPSSSSALPSDSSPEDASKKTGASPGLVRRSSSGRSSGSCELTRLTQEAPLIQPSEVVVCRRDVLLAEPVLTPIERLRREDEAIALALRRKQEIVAELLHIPRDQFETIADLASEPTPEKETAELALACFHQATRLTNLLNESLRVSEEETVSAGANPSSPRPGRHRGGCGSLGKQLPGVPSHLLQDISAALNIHITQMMRVSKERDEERELLRREAQRLREQVHAMHEQRRTGSCKPKRRATATGLSSTSFLPPAPDLSSSEYKSSEEVDTLPAEHSLEVAEPSQEEFVDALCGDGAGSSAAISQDEATPGEEDATSPNH